MSAEKLKIYNEWASRMHALGADLAEYECPRCGFLLHAHVPLAVEVATDTLAQCPNCDGLHMRIVKSDGTAIAKVPDHEVEEAPEVSHAESD